MKAAAALAAVLAAVLALAACSYPTALKYPGARLVGNTASFEGCGFRIGFTGNVRRHGFAADDQGSDYRSSVKRSAILDEAGYDAAQDGRQSAICRCMRNSVEATADRNEASAALQAAFREVAGLRLEPQSWQDGNEMGRTARFEFTLKNGQRAYGGANFSGNCVGAVLAHGNDAAAKRFLDSWAPLQQ
jgi:hypothetical protein